MSLSGQQLWAVPIDLAQFRAPLVLDDLIVTTDKDYMRAFNLQGELQWIADQEGFILADPNTRSQLLTKVNPIKGGSGYKVATPIISLGDGRILAGLEWYSGSGYYIFNVHEHSVRPLGMHLVLGRPLAIPVFPDRGPCLVTAFRFQHAELGDPKSNIILVDMNGKPLWHHPLPIGPGNIIADSSGNIFTFCGHTFDHWDKYHVWYKLEKQCFVRGISPDGNELFTWYAPGPISPSMAIGKNGELFVVSEGKLWAIG
jgi:hypothetical protein